MMKIIRIPLSMGSIDLIPCINGYLQVDTGYARDYPAYRRGLKKASIEISQIKYLFLTHHHDDHFQTHCYWSVWFFTHLNAYLILLLKLQNYCEYIYLRLNRHNNL